MHTIIFYVPYETRMLRHLMHAAARRLPQDAVTVCRNAEELVEIILASSSEQSTLVLSTPTDRELSLVLSLKGMLKHVRNILILPDESDETLGKALQLRPCYHMSVNGNLKEVVAVLEKISQHLKSRVIQQGATGIRAVVAGREHP
jgi:hypothetical protein